MKVSGRLIGGVSVVVAFGLGLVASQLTTPAAAQSGAVIYREGRAVAATDPAFLDGGEVVKVGALAVDQSRGVLYRLLADGRVQALDVQHHFEPATNAARWSGWLDLPR